MISLIVTIYFALASALFCARFVFARPRSLPTTLPWAGGAKSRWTRWLANWSGMIRGREYMDEAHYAYGKKGVSCIMPGPFGEEVMLPARLIPWLIAQPASIMNAAKAHAAQVSADYTMLHKAVVGNPLHEEIIRRELKNQLTNITPGVVDEVSAAISHLWGPRADLKTDAAGFFTVDPGAAFRTIIARVSNRILVGKPLCRNPDFYNNAAAYVADIAAVGYALRLLPVFFRPAVAPLATLVNKYHYWRCSRHLAPLIDDRLKVWNTGDEQLRAAMPNDYLTWSIRDAYNNSHPLERTPYLLALRLLTVNFAVIHTTTMTSTSLLVDLASSSPDKKYIERIRREIMAVTDVRQRFFFVPWTRKLLAKLELLDSAVRESMRVSGFQGKVLTRMVTAPNGVNVPSSSSSVPIKNSSRESSRESTGEPTSREFSNDDKKTMHLPYGTVVNLPGYSIHHDAANFEDPHEFRADRFVGTDKWATTADETFVPWGMGRHACPGRWLAVDVVKMIAAEIILRFDVEIGTAGDGAAKGGMFAWHASPSASASASASPSTSTNSTGSSSSERPAGLERMWMADIGVPNPAARIKLRRRKIE